MSELDVRYVNVSVPRAHAERKELRDVSGQTGVPTLVDGTKVIADDDDAIIDYLDSKYGSAPR